MLRLVRPPSITSRLDSNFAKGSGYTLKVADTGYRIPDSGKLTSGPIFAPDGTRIGTFNSVWRREPDGSWKVVFDRGCPECGCPSEDEATDE